MEYKEYIYILSIISIMCCWLDIINMKKVYKDIVLIIILLLALYCGYLNFPSSPDYEVYNMYYNYATDNFVFSYKDNISDYGKDIYDYGYVWFHTIIKSLGGDLMTVYFFTCLFSLACYYMVLKKYTPYVFITWLLLFGKYFVAQNIIQIRQGLACAIMLLSLKYVYEKKVIKFICIILVATLIHKTLIVALLIYPFSKIHWNRIKVIGMIVFSVLLYSIQIMTNIFFKGIFPLLGVELVKFDNYSGTIYMTSISHFGFIFRLCTVSFFSYFLLKWIDKDYNRIYLSMLMLGFLFLCMFADFNVLSERTATIFFLAFSFVPVVLFNEVKSLKENILTVSFVILMGIVLIVKNYVF